MTSEIKVDTISEQTSANGVTIDGLTIKDGNIIGDVALAGTTPTFTIGDGGAEDAALIFDGNAVDYYMALDDSADDLVIGTGSTVGSNVKITIDSSGNIGLGSTSPDRQIDIESSSVVGLRATKTDGSQFDLQVSGNTSMGTLDSTSLLFTTNNAERMRIDSSGLIGIGNTTASSFDAGANRMVLGTGSGNNGLTIYAQNNASSSIHFADGSSGNASYRGYLQYSHSSDALILATGATEVISFHTDGIVVNEQSNDQNFRIESNGNTHALFVDAGNDRVGFITAPDLGHVHIRTADSGASAHVSADELVIEGSANSGINILSGNSSEGGIYFGDDGDNDIGRIRYDHTNNSLDFFTNASERMTIDSTGAVTIPNQPAFLAQVNTGTVNQENLDTNGSFLTVAFPSEIFDQNADYNASTYTFTAPVTGRYQLNMMIRIQNVDSGANYFGMYTATSNRNWWSGLNQSSGTDRDPQYVTISSSHLADMDANDTAIVRVAQSAGTAQADIGEGFFSAFLAC